MPQSLDEWLAYQTKVHPQTIDLGLGRVKSLLERLHWRQPDLPVVTVAGTNGKGSVTAFCTSILDAAGYRVGTFTSPHLRDYRERIQIQGRLAASADLVFAFERIEAVRRIPPELPLTFFEYNALAAFLLFDAAKLDAWVLEVGLGGRLDAVNAVDATVGVVVSIGFDHQDYLGTTLAAIAREKAGIFRAGQSVILGSREMPDALIEASSSLGVVCKQLGRDFDFTRNATDWDFSGRRSKLAHLPPPSLLGDIQFANAATALAALEELDGKLPVDAAAIALGLASARLPGRFQVVASVGSEPEWILDVAHNVDAARVLAHNLERRPQQGRTLAVCGILDDKDAAGIAAQLRLTIDAWWLAPTPGARGISGEVLAARIRPQVDAPLSVASSLEAACAAARAAAASPDRIVIFGSFHTVGPALDWLAAKGFLTAASLPEYTGALRG